MRLFSPFSPLFFLNCFIIPCCVVAADGDDKTQASNVWNIMPGTTDGGCDNWKTVIDRWHEESRQLVHNAATYLADYARDYHVRKAVQNFFKLRPSKAGIDGIFYASNTEMFDELQGMPLILSRAA